MTDDTQKTKADFYRETVFLPKTEFPMRGNLPVREPEIAAEHWSDLNTKIRARAKAENKPKWVLHDGPPYANGNIHMGHAVNKILKDVIVKSWQMNGYDAPYVPGWDCHGLPIEWKIEEKYRNAGQDKDDVDQLQFRDECRKFAGEWVAVQSDQFQRLGVIGDWDNPYLTMTNRAEGKIAREIHKFALNGGLYRDKKIIMWSVVEKTSLAEAEVEYKDHKSVTIWVRFPVEQAFHPLLNGADIVIWTTTPWTIPSNRAIAFGGDVEYGVYEVKAVAEDSPVELGAKLVMAVSLADDVLAQGKITEFECLGTVFGHDITDTNNGMPTICKHPLAELDEYYKEFNVPLLSGDFVTDDAGTGFVHIAPDHGEDDFNLVRDHNIKNSGTFSERNDDGTTAEILFPEQIEITDNVTDDGKFRDHVGLFSGLEIYTQKGKLGDGNFAVLRELANVGKLFGKKSITHEYPHSWRSKAPIIFRSASPQWFIAMDNEIKLRDTALNAIKDTNWIPQKGEARITSMVANRPDWCISRQRAWGVPIALFLNKDSGEILKDAAVLNRIGEIFETEGADAWWSRDAADFLGSDYNADDYDQVFDIVDVWFESGSTHAFVVDDRDDLRQEDGSQVDLYLEGSDQHRGWFHSSLLESCGTRGRAPYKNVLTHGFVLDDKGYKMSKSLGNVVDPLKTMEQSGADILRLWTMTSDYAEDIRIGKDSMKATSDLYRRIRNTLRFLLGALDGFTTDEAVDVSTPEALAELPELEQLTLNRLYDMDAKIRGMIEGYDFSKLAKTLHDFCNEDLSAFYFDIRKDSLYCDSPDTLTRRACRTVMAEIFQCLSAWLAPVLSFTAEEAWQSRPAGIFEDAESVHLREFPTIPDQWRNSELAEKWIAIADIRRVIFGALEPSRADKTIGSSLEAAPVVYVSDAYAKAIDGQDLAEIAIVSQAQIKTETAPDDAFALSDVDGVSVVFAKAEGEKCQRCWKILPEVGSDPDYPDLSLRDADAVRWFASNKKAA
jgi:isoleucyl-tRNA synthetase